MADSNYTHDGSLYVPSSARSKKTISKSVGKTGTNIFSGYIDVDYSTKWQNLRDRVDIINEMIGSDSTIGQILDAKKVPLLSAKYFLIPADDSSEAMKVKDFVHENLFGRIDYQSHMIEALTHYDYGFSMFAINYSIENGKTFWKEFKFLEQKTIEEWGINQTDWVNGHPQGITQRTSNGDEVTDKKIPKSNAVTWDRLLRYTHSQKGNNFEGVSVLRRAYIHWYYKNLFYKIGGIFGDRYGAGVPTMKFKPGTNQKQKEEFIELVKNIRVNEQSYAVYEEGNELRIITPEGTGAQDFLMDFIKHQDKKIYDAASAGFLNLSSGDGGSNALSKDLSSFFTRGLQSDADYLLSIQKKLIQKLLYLNVIPLELTPRLIASDIGQLAIGEYIEAASKAKKFKLVTWTAQDEEKVRAQLKLDPLPEDVEPDYDISNSSGDTMEEEDETKLSKKKTLLQKIKVSEREKIFSRNISDYENFLESSWFEVEKILIASELKYQKGLELIYKSTDTILKDGQRKIDKTKKNRELEKTALKFIDAVTKSLKDKILMSPIQKKIFSITEKMSLQNLKDNEKEFLESEIQIDSGKFNSFIAGYISNISGILFNEPRRIKESAVLNFGSGVALVLALEQARKIKFNRNTAKLSVLAHPRGAYNGVLFDENEKNGFVFYKYMVPKSKIKTISPSGQTAKVLYMIDTASRINRRANKGTDGKNTSAINGLNLHHGSFLYFFPIASDEKEDEETTAREQRKEFLEQFGE